jgi:2-polyprenyl-3-methyl-5-hydroxy-6-metoxy-1,4-benzoquinol methylase
VTGLDVSSVAVEQTKERARELGVHVDARLQDVETFDFGANRWDLVCLLYFIISEQQRSLYQRIATSLKPGGLVIVEGLGLPVLETLMQAWSKWEPTKLRLLRLEYRDGASDWGGPATGRLLVQKPTGA